MAQPRKIVGVVGLMFFAVAVFNFFRGENWIVWVILGLLFGGVSGVQSLMNRQGER